MVFLNIFSDDFNSIKLKKIKWNWLNKVRSIKSIGSIKSTENWAITQSFNVIFLFSSIMNREVGQFCFVYLFEFTS